MGQDSRWDRHVDVRRTARTLRVARWPLAWGSIFCMTPPLVQADARLAGSFSGATVRRPVVATVSPDWQRLVRLHGDTRTRVIGDCAPGCSARLVGACHPQLPLAADKAAAAGEATMALPAEILWWWAGACRRQACRCPPLSGHRLGVMAFRGEGGGRAGVDSARSE